MKSKCENEAKKQDADLWYDTRDTTEYILEENYVQTDLEKREKLVKNSDGKTGNDGDVSTVYMGLKWTPIYDVTLIKGRDHCYVKK